MSKGLPRSARKVFIAERHAYKETVCQSSTGLGLCMKLGMSMELLSPNTEDGRVKKMEGNLIPDNVVGMTNELSQSCPTLRLPVLGDDK